MILIKLAITGNENHSNLTQAYDALVAFYDAFNHQNMALMEENWSTAKEIAMDNPLGGIKRGWPEIRSVYEKIFDGPAQVYVEFYDYSLHTTENMFYAVGRERGHFKMGDQTLDLAIRTSRIYRKIDGIWRQVHHHGSIENPDLLKQYQEIVRKQ